MEELIACLAVYGSCFGFAAYVAWTHPNWKGTLIASGALWFFLFLGNVFLNGRYSSGGPAGAVLIMWMLAGWIPSAIFATATTFIRRRIISRHDLRAELRRG